MGSLRIKIGNKKYKSFESFKSFSVIEGNGLFGNKKYYEIKINNIPTSSKFDKVLTKKIDSDKDFKITIYEKINELNVKIIIGKAYVKEQIVHYDLRGIYSSYELIGKDFKIKEI